MTAPTGTALADRPAAASAGRLWEVDAARTVAIAMMVVYHAGYDVHVLAPSIALDVSSGGWRALQISTGSLFLFIVGVSLAVSNGGAQARGLGYLDAYRRHLRRVVRVLAAALLVSLATFLVLGREEYIRFGILSCITVAMLVGGLVAPLGLLNLPLAAGALAGGLALGQMDPTNSAALIALGVPSAGDFGVDLYPVLPWLAPALFGLAVGRRLYPGGRRGGWGTNLPTPPGAILAGLPGRYSLSIYLVQQLVLLPLVAGVLLLTGVEVAFSGP